MSRLGKYHKHTVSIGRQFLNITQCEAEKHFFFIYIVFLLKEKGVKILEMNMLVFMLVSCVLLKTITFFKKLLNFKFNDSKNVL